MKRRIVKYLFCATALLVSIALASCSGGTGGGGGSGAGRGDSASMSAEDYPNWGVCLTGSTDVTDATFVAALAAFTEFTFVHLPYTDDTDIPFICGAEPTWDPENNPNAFATFNPDIPIATPITDVLQGLAGGQVLICNSGFAFAALNFGFHDENTFRGEIFFETGGQIYRLRVRFTVTGDNAGKTLADAGVAVTDLKLQDSTGADLATIGDVLALFAADAGSVSIQLVSNSTVHIAALGRVLCWENITP